MLTRAKGGQGPPHRQTSPERILYFFTAFPLRPISKSCVVNTSLRTDVKAMKLKDILLIICFTIDLPPTGTPPRNISK